MMRQRGGVDTVESHEDPSYWDGVGDEEDRLPAEWREYSRDMHLALFRQWIGPPLGCWLKTDLFEELHPSRTLVPLLPSTCWVGVDLSPRIAIRSGKCGAERAVADVRRLPFADGSFDGILSTSTLDHFRDEADLRAALAELHRILRPGGRLFLTLDNPQNPFIHVRNRLPHRVARSTGLVPFFVGRTLSERRGRQALAATGFAVHATTHLLHVPFIIGTRAARYRWYATRVMPRFDRLGQTRLAPYSGHFVAFLASRA